ncbi:CHAT domain-containing protein [Aquincola sp. S2]|uniref:CHAT domain-containing protein n=1 Tax=Pseudaquabacterium terrae TaxID=2732868 RepID=A0ABX2EAU2_9BURK|nr:CHAT domain-containing protein [Aquabacterium terrae]NRF65442.1 CHAT domain-containing protein [Aquabacterium terrae]
MQEIRVLFTASAGNGLLGSLTDADGKRIGTEVPFTLSLPDDDYVDLRWYLEEYMELPDGGAVVRAERIEANLSKWGRQLHDALFSAPENKAALKLLLDAEEPRQLTIATSDPALLRLPWELMADDAGSLALRVSIRRQLSTPESLIPREVQLPLRILYIVSRPEDAGFIDPRVTTKALVAALDPLGAAVKLDFCRPPTLKRMGEMLRAAQQEGDSYDVVHFDGHGTFMQQQQLGALCFEQSDDGSGDSKTDLVPADQLGNLLAQHKIPLVVLEACRSAEMKSIVFRSVAPRLIQAGVGSVLSMGHAVHVQAATILLDRFYRELVRGTTIGHAVAQGRSALVSSPTRWLEYGPGARTLRLQDWFLPHLYQRGTDDALLPPDLAKQQAVRQFDLFLSHNHNDSTRVEALARTLSEKHGLRVWLDKWECDPGKLEPQCEAGIRHSRFTVVAGSQSALNSNWVEWEIGKHLALNPEADHLLPIKLEPLTLPPHLGDNLWVDFTDPAQDAANAALLARLIRTTDAADARKRRGFRPPARQRDEHGPFPPAPTYGFHGRARELLMLERQFRSQRGIVLHAMGGMGKTTLATEAADWWTRSGLFRDGACFASFEQFTSAERVVQVLGCYVAGEKFNQLPAGEQRKRAVEFMRQHAVLLVWDNYESALPQFNDGAAAIGSPYTDEERTRLAELFRDLTTGPGRGAVLVTCRPGDTGLPGARRHELHGLARADSLWLLAEILQKHDLKLSDARFTREKLDPLLRDLADHPLSLELVGPHLKTLTPEAIRADFGTLLTLFQQDASPGPDGKPGRNSSLLASLEFSRRHLSPAAREALPWLGLFSGGVFEDLLLDVSQITPEALAPIRRELQSIALVRPEDEIQIGGRPFLRFHPTLASAAAAGALAQQPQTRQRLIHVYLALSQALDKAMNGSQSRAALAILDREEANYRTAVHLAIRDGLIREAAALGITLKNYLERSSRLRERDAWVTMLRDATAQGTLTPEAALYEQEDAYRRFQQGDPEGAVEQLQTLIDRLRSTSEFDSAFHLALAVGALGDLLNDRGAGSQAVPFLQEAVSLWEALIEKAWGRPWESLLATGDHVKAFKQLGNLSAAMGNLANALCDTGRHDEALKVAEEALQIDIQYGNQREIGVGHGQCANILMAAGRHDEADARYELAVAAARQTGDKAIEGSLLQHQGGLASKRNELTRAALLYQQALLRFQEAGNPGSMMRTYNLLGVVERKASRLAEARAWYEKSRKLAVDLKDQACLGQAAQNISVVCLLEGEAAREQGDEPAAKHSFQIALRSAEEGLRIMQALANQPDEAGALSQLALIHRCLGDLAAAEHHAHAARQIRESLGLKEVFKDYNTLSQIAEARGDTAAAEWAQKRDAMLEELRRLAGGGGGVPLKALQALAIACAQAGLSGAPPGPAEAEALATLDGMPAPFPDFSATLCRLASGEMPPIPDGLPTELRDLLTATLKAMRDATQPPGMQ